MNKSLTKPLIRPLGGRWARVCLTALLTTVVTVGAQAQAAGESGTQTAGESGTQTCTCTADRGGAQAQAMTQAQTCAAGRGGAQAQTMTQTQTCTTDRGGAQAQAAGESGTQTAGESGTQTQACAAGRGGAQDLAAGGEIVLTPPRDLNSELRHRTWSFYTQGGLSWATGVWYRNLDAKRSYRQSAAAGAALAQIIQKLEDLKGSIGGGGTTPSPVEYVDLGLPSGLKWAKCNLGAPKPSEPGDHYAWGETDPKAEYTWATYKWMQAGQSEAKYITKYTIADGETGGIWYDSSGAFIGDNKTALVAADDAATAKLGSPWRMPTIDEFQELIDKCTWTWTTQDGVNGYQVDGPNGNAIFLPAGYLVIGSYRAGYYWSSSLSTTESDCAYSLDLNSDRYFIARTYRYFGCTVRPVRP